MRRVVNGLAVACLVLLATGVARGEDNLEYTAWAKCKPGTSIIMVSVFTMGPTKKRTETKTTLIEVAAEKCVVEMVQHIESGHQVLDMPPMRTDVPRAGQSSVIMGDDPKTSEEEVNVPAGTFKTKAYETSMELGDGKMTRKVWTSDEAPGGVVKMESTTTSPGTTTKEELVKVDRR